MFEHIKVIYSFNLLLESKWKIKVTARWNFHRKKKLRRTNPMNRATTTRIEPKSWAYDKWSWSRIKKWIWKYIKWEQNAYECHQ